MCRPVVEYVAVRDKLSSFAHAFSLRLPGHEVGEGGTQVPKTKRQQESHDEYWVKPCLEDGIVTARLGVCGVVVAFGQSIEEDVSGIGV